MPFVGVGRALASSESLVPFLVLAAASSGSAAKGKMLGLHLSISCAVQLRPDVVCAFMAVLKLSLLVWEIVAREPAWGWGGVKTAKKKLVYQQKLPVLVTKLPSPH